jgi:hypothetical protein
LHTDRIILSKEIGKQIEHKTALDILLRFFTIIDSMLGYWMLDAGCWMLDAEYWMLDAEYWMLGARCGDKSS